MRLVLRLNVNRGVTNIKIKDLFFFFILFLLTSLTASANENEASLLTLTDQESTFSAAYSVSYLEDASHTLTLNELLSPDYANKFIKNTKPIANFGRSRSIWWAKFSVVDRSHTKWYLLLDAMLSDELDFYVLSRGKEITQQVTKPLKDYRRHAWSITFPPNEPVDIYFRLTNGDSIVALPIEFVAADNMIERSNKDYRLFGALYIGMLILALYQLFMFVILRETSYITLAVNILAMIVVTHQSNPVFEWLPILGSGHYFFTAALNIALMTNVVFARQILDVKKDTPIIHFLFHLFFWLCLILIFTAGASPSGGAITLLVALLIVLVTFFSSLYIAWKKKSRIALYFTGAYAIPTVTNLLGLLTLLFFPEIRQASDDALAAVSTLSFMLLLAVIQAERVRLQREKMQLIEVSGKAKDEFLAMMSHELRTPMNALVGLGTLLKLTPLNTLQQRYVGKLDLASQHMMQLISNVLDFAKVRNQSFQIEHQGFNVGIAMHSIHDMLEQHAEQKGLPLHLEKTDALTLNIMGDRGHLSQILINLLTNSLKYTQNGSVTLAIKQLPTPETETKRVLLQFEITDTGIGIPPDTLDHLFDPFKQVKHNGKVSSDGVGLGLSISKSLVELMGGKIQVESELDEGSRFFFELSFDIARREDVPEALEELKLVEFALPKGLRILLTDDSSMNRYVGEEMIKNMGGHVTLAASGESAIVQLQQHPFDIVLMDINMPGMDGFEVTKWIRENGNSPNIPIIALTAHNLSRVKQQCDHAGMNDFLAKPFSYEALYWIIMKAIK